MLPSHRTGGEPNFTVAITIGYGRHRSARVRTVRAASDGSRRVRFSSPGGAGRPEFPARRRCGRCRAGAAGRAGRGRPAAAGRARPASRRWRGGRLRASRGCGGDLPLLAAAAAIGRCSWRLAARRSRSGADRLLLAPAEADAGEPAEQAQRTAILMLRARLRGALRSGAGRPAGNPRPAACARRRFRRRRNERRLGAARSVSGGIG